MVESIGPLTETETDKQGSKSTNNNPQTLPFDPLLIELSILVSRHICYDNCGRKRPNCWLNFELQSSHVIQKDTGSLLSFVLRVCVIEQQK